jgi:hypothetical protein
MIDDPSRALNWLQQINPVNVKHLTKLQIFVHAVYHLGPFPNISGRPPSGPQWCKLLDKLASDAEGLQEIYIS